MKKPNLKKNDIHIVVDAKGEKAKLFAFGEATPRWIIPVRCYGSTGNSWVPGGDTPPGLYKMGIPEKIPTNDPQINSFGYWFIDLIEQENQEINRGRAGIGFHGGGSGLPNPLAPYQGWMVTHGCIRCQNADLEKVVNSVKYTQKNGGTAWLTVVW